MKQVTALSEQLDAVKKKNDEAAKKVQMVEKQNFSAMKVRICLKKKREYMYLKGKIFIYFFEGIRYTYENYC